MAAKSTSYGSALLGLNELNGAGVLVEHSRPPRAIVEDFDVMDGDRKPLELQLWSSDEALGTVDGVLIRARPVVLDRTCPVDGQALARLGHPRPQAFHQEFRNSAIGTARC